MVDDANSPATSGTFPRLIAIGLLAGLFSTIFGVGGGLVMVPLLVLLCRFNTKFATATSLAAIIGTATVGVLSHGALGNVEWGYALLIGLPAIGGLLAGLWIKSRMTSEVLTYAFTVLLVIVGALLVIQQAEQDSSAHLSAGRIVATIPLGFGAGALAGLFGVGGGILFVPTLTLILGLGQLSAEGTSLLAIIPVALVGSWRQHREGTVDWRAAGVMAAASAATAVAGALIADATPPAVLRIMFAVLLAVTALQLVQRTRASR